MLDSYWGRWRMAAGPLFVLSAMLAGLLVGCGEKAAPEAAEVKKFRPADDSAPAVAAAEPAGAKETPDFGTGRNIVAGNRPATASAAAEKPSEATAQNEPAPASGEAPQVSAEIRPVLEELNRLARQQPKGNSEREQLEDGIRIQTRRLTLAKKALGMKPSVELKRELVMAINQIYQEFVDAGVPSAMAQLSDFAKTMSADADPLVSQMGRHAQFAANFSRIASRPLEDGKEIVAEAKKLLEPERGNVNQGTLQLLVNVANHLMEAGFTDDAADIFELMADTLAADSKLADEAPRFAMEAKVRRLDMNTLLANVARGKPEAEAKIAEAARTMLAENAPTAELLNHVLTIAHNLESFGNYELAQKCFDQISAAYRDVEAPELADAKHAAAKAAQRVGLIGQPFTVEGVTMDGAPFDWSAYAGKVVLVDFWATWCRPCLEEMPNIRRNFEDFHAKGFEVVGISLNTVASDLQQFLSVQSLPWTTVTSQVVLDGQVDRNDWTKLPMATKAGVASIPFVVLVGKDGKVDSIHVRGPKLRSRLMELLGDPITTEVPADPTVPSAKAKADGGKQSNVMPDRRGRGSIWAPQHHKSK
jgi:thiol-disulfide isomerase/thioredoxin